jgi:hypothetical protein
MPWCGEMSVVRGVAALPFGWNRCQVGFSNLLRPLWMSEPKKPTRTMSSVNKAEDPGHLMRWIYGEVFLLPAGHEGEGGGSGFSLQDLLSAGGALGGCASRCPATALVVHRRQIRSSRRGGGAMLMAL